MISFVNVIIHILHILKTLVNQLPNQIMSLSVKDVRHMLAEMMLVIIGKSVSVSFQMMPVDTGNVLLVHVLHHLPIKDILVFRSMSMG